MLDLTGLVVDVGDAHAPDVELLILTRASMPPFSGFKKRHAVALHLYATLSCEISIQFRCFESDLQWWMCDMDAVSQYRGIIRQDWAR